jgi:endonuclease-3
MKSSEERINDIILTLRNAYPETQTALDYKTPLQLLVATILSAQCTDERVNKVTPGLFQKYPDAQAFAQAVPSELEEAIHSTGFFRNKAKHIIGASKKIVDDFNGQAPDTMEALLTLPGVARKTANIILASVFKKAEGIAVDTHVHRLANRLGLSQKKSPDQIEKDLLKLVPKQDWIDFNFLLVNHGRSVCVAKKPKCSACRLNTLCPSSTIT